MQKGLFVAIIGTIESGIVLTTLGTVIIFIGKLVKGYGVFFNI